MPKVPIGSKQRSRSEEYFKEYVEIGFTRLLGGITNVQEIARKLQYKADDKHNEQNASTKREQ
ncbi:MAG: hypothetical protein A2252_06230 [Elusimicrobia bacterium RIFOXYA2_FULL_39_19]|nr:MAG: hypothetical protein A2252_06230 [Elusimicrobia bacterium RIFOXYA2_FULL_39_19]